MTTTSVLQFLHPRRALTSFAQRMAPKAALPKTGAAPRRCYYIKGLTKMPRAMLERICPSWGVDPAGRTKDQIIDLLFHADNQLGQSRCAQLRAIHRRSRRWYPQDQRSHLW